MNKLIEELHRDIIGLNEGYQFLFKDNIFIPIYQNDLVITKRDVIKLNLVEEKVLQIIDIGVYHVDEIADILGINSRLLDITLADLSTRDMIIVTSETCRLLELGKSALKDMQRIEKHQDILKNIYIDGLFGKIISAKYGSGLVDRARNNDNKLKVLSEMDYLEKIKGQFKEINEIFMDENNEYIMASKHLVEQELLTIDGIEKCKVVFLKIPIGVFVSNTGIDIDVISLRENMSEVFSEYKDEIIKQINNKKVLKKHFTTKTLNEKYEGEQLQKNNDLCALISSIYYGKNNMEMDSFKDVLFSKRMLYDGELEIILHELAAESEVVQLIIRNLDDWAYNFQFVGSLSGILEKCELQIKYSETKNREKAIKQFKRGFHNIKVEKELTNYYICWILKGYKIYGLPNMRDVIDSQTKCVTVDYYIDFAE